MVSYSDGGGGEAAVCVANGCSLNRNQSNLDAGPSFVDRGGPDDDAATWDDNDHQLAGGSPCINAGGPGFLPQPDEPDIGGQVRVWDGDPDVDLTDLAALLIAYRTTCA
jgi:hypothetical protein